MDRIWLRDVNWIGDKSLDLAVGDGLEIFVRVRSTRRPQPAWLRAIDGEYQVELIAGEDGVSPGQACVFYDAPEGQARVLGGGFIKSAAPRAANNGARGAAATSRPLVAGDVVYVPSTSGTVYALALDTGTERWRSTTVRGEVRATPVLSGGALLVASRKGQVAALDPATGAERQRNLNTVVLLQPGAAMVVARNLSQTITATANYRYF